MLRALLIVVLLIGAVVLAWMLIFAGVFPSIERLLKRLRRGPADRPRRQLSSVETNYLRMNLDDRTGAIDGLVLRGRFTGRRVGDLVLEQLFELLAETHIREPEAAALLEAYLDRFQPDWRDRFETEEPDEADGPAALMEPMTRAEAYAVLGLELNAGEGAILEAHRRLTTRLRPDQGGSSYLAMKINQAKDVLLSP